MYEQDFEL